MKQLTVLIICLLFSGVSRSQSVTRMLDSLVAQNDFFSVQKILLQPLAITGNQRLYYEALADNAFNRTRQSATGIAIVLQSHSGGLTDSQKLVLYSAQIFNYLKLYDYKNAWHTASDVLAGKAGPLDSAAAVSYSNMALIAQTLAAVPPQITDAHGTVTIKTRRDMAGLLRLPVFLNGAKKKTDYIFDTGANMSVLTESEAQKHRVRILQGNNVSIKGGAGNNVASKLGVADSINIGGIVVRNVVFLVLPDEALTFNFILFKYRIKGIIGYPVMQQLKEVQITKKNITIPAASTPKRIGNLALQGYVPVLQAATEYGDTGCYIFDSGAKATHFYYPYFLRYRHSVEQAGRKKTIAIAGAGHQAEKEVYVLKKTVVKTAGTFATLKKVPVYMDDGAQVSKGFQGIIGQDFIRQFDTVTLNFEYMYIEFR